MLFATDISQVLKINNVLSQNYLHQDMTNTANNFGDVMDKLAPNGHYEMVKPQVHSKHIPVHCTI